MNSNDSVQADIRDNKIKEGLLVKRSRHLKQWKERWMVLTKTYLYSFVQKGVYKNPTQTIPLKDIETLKSYYKNQYDRPHTFRIESPEVNFHMYAKNSQQKWAWMTAIEKMTEKLIHPENKTDSYNLIRETIKMSSVVRESIQKKQQRKKSMITNITDSEMRKLKLSLEERVINIKHEGSKEKNAERNQSLNEQKLVEKIVEKKVQIPVEKIVEKKIQVPVQKIVYEEKIMYVPEIKEKIVQKIIYKDSNTSSSSSSEGVFTVLDEILNAENDNSKPVVDFVIWLLTSRIKKFYNPTLQFCLNNQNKRFFAEKFLLMLNDETDEEKINFYLKFLLILYENCEEYFYSSDAKVLIDILLRQLEFNRSEFNQYLIMLVFKSLSEKKWWIGQNHRKNDIRMLVKELEMSSGPDNQVLAGQLLSKI